MGGRGAASGRAGKGAVGGAKVVGSFRGKTVYDKLPSGWKVDETANWPAGYKAINNGKSRFNGEHKSAYIIHK